MAKVKMKTNRGAMKRFKKTASGKYKCRRAKRNHILTKKSTKVKRHRRQSTLVRACDTKSVRRMLRVI